MDVFCPACQTRMEALTDPREGARRHYQCPRCEGEYTAPAGSAESRPNGAAAPGVAVGSDTQPGFTVQGIPGVEWQVPNELQFCLKVVEGAETGKVFEVTRSRVTIGREEGEILIGDPLVSRKHAAFEIYGSRHIVIKDLASTNGTYINGRLIAYSKLNNGDRVKIGSTVLEAVIEVAP